MSKWIYNEYIKVHDDGRKFMIKRWCYCCSECGQPVITEPIREAILSFITCPYCGARMEGADDERTDL